MIESIRTYHVTLPLERELRTAIHRIDRIDNVLEEISAGGLTGIGYAFTFNRQQALAVRAATHGLAEVVKARPELGVVDQWHAMWEHLNFTGQAGIGVLAMNAIDTALWDLHAQQAGMPLFRLLGGSRTSLPLYATGGWISYPIAELVQEGRRLRDLGFTNYKIKIGFEDWREDVRRLQELQSAVGPELAIQVDANQAWRVHDAMAAGRAFQDCGVYWYEEPTSADDVVGSAEIARELDVPIATGETVYGVAAFRRLIEGRAADVYMPDLMRCGGVTGFRDVAAFADAHHVPVSSHTFTEISAHLMAAVPNGTLVEYIPGWWDELFQDAPEVRDGRMHLNENPGLGFSFSGDAKEKYGLDDGATVE